MADTDQWIDSSRATYLERKAGRSFDALMATCDSHIERQALAAFIGFGFDTMPPGSETAPNVSPILDRRRITSWRALLAWPAVVDAKQGGFAVLLCSQPYVESLSARADFCILGVKEEHAFWIELDGHEFHERSKDQAERDKARDRRVACANWRVLRLTGTEVDRDPHAAMFRLGTDVGMWGPSL